MGVVQHLLLLALAATAVNGAKKIRRVQAGRKYQEHDDVHIVVNKVGYVRTHTMSKSVQESFAGPLLTPFPLFSHHLCSPFNNPTETYRYYSLPFCHTHATEAEERAVAEEENVDVRVLSKQGGRLVGAVRHKQRMGESLVGDRRETSPYEITFQDSVDWRLLCKKELDEKELEQLKKAIHNNYFFEMFVEDLPMWGYIGDVSEEDVILEEFEGDSGKTFLFPHLHFYLGYNKDQIVAARVTTDVSTVVCVWMARACVCIFMMM